MSRLIDADKLNRKDVNCANVPMNFIDTAPTVDAILKADNENRLKADLKAMLTELQLEIEEKEQYYQDEFLKQKNAVHDAAMCGRMFGCGECKEIIQQKINALSGGNEE